MDSNGNRDTRRTVNLDPQTDKLLQRLANQFDGNLSMAARNAIRSEAERRGLIAQDHNRAYASQAR